LKSFKYAFEGWWHVVRTQKNAWIHTVATILVILFSIWLKISSMGWAILLLAIGMVWLAEFLNTALEIIVDIASPKSHPSAKIAKDVGAASVLIAAVSSIIIGVIILGPPFFQKVQNLLDWLN
jgi:diacylglycerol kinase